MTRARFFPVLTVGLLAMTVPLTARHPATRPPIVGVAHIALETNEAAAAKAFYGTGFGFAEIAPTRFKVNDHQYIDVSPNLKSETQDRLDNIAFETTNVRRLRDYLAAKGIAVPTAVKKDADGNLSLEVLDPDHHRVEFIQYMKGSLQSRQFGKLVPATRVSDRIIHVGVTVVDRAAADAFYRDILGFKLTWYGGRTDSDVSWIDMRVPEGSDWLEYMLVRSDAKLSPKQLGVLHHLALGVPDIQAGFKTVSGRGISAPQPPKIGRDGKWQLNLYDANFTRTELMEFKPVEKPCCSPYVNQPEPSAMSQ